MPNLTRREFLRGATAATAALAAGGANALSLPTRPNIVFILADQLRYQSCGFAGDPLARTPNIDRLASQGTSFCNAVSGHPVCSAFRASLLTGKYTTSTGMVINELRMNPGHRFLARVLSDGGYDTAYIGKWHLWADELGNHEDPKNSFVPPGEYRFGFDGFFAGYNFHHAYYRGYYHSDSPEKIPVEGYEPDVQTSMAIQQLERLSKGSKPFALFLSVGTPHDPWGKDNVPPEYLKQFADVRFKLPPNYKPENDPYSDAWGVFKDSANRKSIPDWMRVYYAMTANLDHNVGRLLKAVQQAGIADDTIVVFTSDHGEMFGSQGRRAKNIFYEEAVRVPFIIRLPGKTQAGRVSDACLNTPDIMPTLLSLCRLDIPDKVEGADLSAAVRGEAGPDPEAALLMNTGACASWGDGFEWRAVRDKHYTYAIYRKDQSELLFDNTNDPHQLYNLAHDARLASTLERLREVMRRQMQRIGDDFRPNSYYRDHWVSGRTITYTGP